MYLCSTSIQDLPEQLGRFQAGCRDLHADTYRHEVLVTLMFWSCVCGCAGAFSPFHAFSRMFRQHADARDGGAALHGVSRAALNKMVGVRFFEGMRKPSRNVTSTGGLLSNKLSRHFLKSRWRTPDDQEDCRVLSVIFSSMLPEQVDHCITLLREFNSSRIGPALNQFKSGPAGRRGLDDGEDSDFARQVSRSGHRQSRQIEDDTIACDAAALVAALRDKNRNALPLRQGYSTYKEMPVAWEGKVEGDSFYSTEMCGVDTCESTKLSAAEAQVAAESPCLDMHRSHITSHPHVETVGASMQWVPYIERLEQETAEGTDSFEDDSWAASADTETHDSRLSFELSTSYDNPFDVQECANASCASLMDSVLVDDDSEWGRYTSVVSQGALQYFDSDAQEQDRDACHTFDHDAHEQDARHTSDIHALVLRH